MARLRQSRPHDGLDFQVQVLKTLLLRILRNRVVEVLKTLVLNPVVLFSPGGTNGGGKKRFDVTTGGDGAA